VNGAAAVGYRSRPSTFMPKKAPVCCHIVAAHRR